MTSLNKIFHYINFISKKYNIDESHGIKHSMDVVKFAHNIFSAELINNPELNDQINVVYISALLHDMCDKKYMDENEGIRNLEEFIGISLNYEELNAIKNIIGTMSYSKVMKNGRAEFPDLGKWQLAYNIVREADLLAAYDFDRCMIYNMEKKSGDFDSSFVDAKQLFDNRVFKHFEHGLFLTDKGKELGRMLHISAIDTIKMWNNLSTKNIL
jgi:HD superfamily phosphodiesterase